MPVSFFKFLGKASESGTPFNWPSLYQSVNKVKVVVNLKIPTFNNNGVLRLKVPPILFFIYILRQVIVSAWERNSLTLYRRQHYGVQKGFETPWKPRG